VARVESYLGSAKLENGWSCFFYNFLSCLHSRGISCMGAAFWFRINKVLTLLSVPGRGIGFPVSCLVVSFISVCPRCMDLGFWSFISIEAFFCGIWCAMYSEIFQSIALAVGIQIALESETPAIGHQLVTCLCTTTFAANLYFNQRDRPSGDTRKHEWNHSPSVSALPAPKVLCWRRWDSYLVYTV
jgi:hypothetical protein